MFARRIVVVGTGYVGLTTGACLASLGHRVVCSDVNEEKVAELSRGEVRIHEPGLAELVQEGIADVARIKLGAFDLLDRFDLGIGAFGDDHLRRGGLVPIARERARLKLGIDFAPDRVVLIGDTLNDVRAAHESGARLVAVATGSFSAEELRSAGAEVVFEALPPPEVLRQALG